MPDSVNKSAPFISVVMNCYNSERYLRETLESLFSQTYTNWELVFWDNGSVDSSRKILEEFQDERVKYFYYPERTTLGKARNMAISKTTGQWIAFLDCDDTWEKNKLFEQVRIIESESSDLGLVYGRTRMLLDDKPGPDYYPKFEHQKLPEGDVALDLLIYHGNFMSCVSVLFRKDLLLSVGGIPENYKFAEDFYVYAHIAALSRVRAVQEICCHGRLHSSNFTLQIRHVGFDEYIRIIESLRPYLLQKISASEINRKIRELHTMSFIYKVRAKKNPDLLTFLRNGSLMHFANTGVRAILRRFSLVDAW